MFLPHDESCKHENHEKPVCALLIGDVMTRRKTRKTHGKITFNYYHADPGSYRNLYLFTTVNIVKCNLGL